MSTRRKTTKPDDEQSRTPSTTASDPAAGGGKEKKPARKSAAKKATTRARKGTTRKSTAKAKPATGVVEASPSTSRSAASANADEAHATTAAPARGTGPDETPAPAGVEAGTEPRVLQRTPMSVRWRDLDAFNHVNNAKYLTYLEEARLRWMMSLPGLGLDDDVAPVVAAAHVNYRRPIEWPGDVDIELFVERLGNTSVSLGHRIVAARDPGVLYCDGHVVLVWIDRTSGRAAPLPSGVRESCTA